MQLQWKLRIEISLGLREDDFSNRLTKMKNRLKHTYAMKEQFWTWHAG